jgi:4'-phosphopantetheinyl transferase
VVGGFRGAVSAPDFSLELADLREVPAWEVLLSPDEAQRAAAMTNPALRARFVVSRGMRRKFLGKALGLDPGILQFAEAEGAKPRLSANHGWDFNLSHAGDYVVLAIGRGDVGVDLEKMRPVREMAALADRYFHADEAAAWRAVPAGRQEAAFFVLWSAREAAMKCTGTGLARGLAQTRVDPVILESDRAAGVVGRREVLLRKEPAPAGYVLVTARMVS